MNKDILHKKLITICQANQDHYGLGINPSEFLNWYDSLSKEEKDILIDIILENFTGYRYVSVSRYVKSEKILKYVVDFLNDAIRKKRIKDICPIHFSTLLDYETNNEVKDIIVYFMDKVDNLDLDPTVKWDPLMVLCSKHPELIEKYLPRLKEIYHCYGNSMIIGAYSGLINLHRQNFPEVFMRITKDLTEKETNRILETLPVIFSNGKYDDIKDEIYRKLEELLNKKIDRSLKY